MEILIILLQIIIVIFFIIIIIIKGKKIMTSLETLQAFVNDLNTETSRIADLIATLLVKINDGTITPNEVTAELQPVVDGLRALGANPPEVKE